MPSSPTPRVLAIDPLPMGAAFAVLEGEVFLLDWGFKVSGSRGSKAFLRRIQSLIERYEPDVLVLEDPTGEGSHRRPPAKRAITLLRGLAKECKLRCEIFSREDVRAVFPSDHRTKRRIAEEIALRFPELQESLPPARKWYESGEDERMSVFDAVALALAYFHATTKTHSGPAKSRAPHVGDNDTQRR
jgi:hypothetical protein